MGPYRAWGAVGEAGGCGLLGCCRTVEQVGSVELWGGVDRGWRRQEVGGL